MERSVLKYAGGGGAVFKSVYCLTFHNYSNYLAISWFWNRNTGFHFKHLWATKLGNPHCPHQTGPNCTHSVMEIIRIVLPLALRRLQSGGHRVHFSGKEGKHEQGVDVLVHKDIVKSVIGCRPISSRLMTVRLRASPFNITIIQAYAPTSSYDDSEVDEFNRELQSLVDKTPKQDILVVQGDWNAKVGEDTQEDWREVCGPSCNPETNVRWFNILDFATYKSLVLANTLGNHKPSRWTWRSPDGTHHNQTDYLLVNKRFRSGSKTARTRTVPGTDVGSDHDMVMMTFQTRLKSSMKPTQPRIRFDLEKLNDPTVMSAFHRW